MCGTSVRRQLLEVEAAAATLLYGLLGFGQIPTRRIDGYLALQAAFPSSTVRAA